MALRLGARLFWLAPACMLWAGFGPARAGDDPNDSANLVKKEPANASIFTFNYGPTQSPALNLLGASPSKAQLYSSYQPFILSIPSLFSGSGSQAVGLDFSPAWALHPWFPISANDYTNASDPMRAWYRLRVELAGANGAASTTASKITPSGIAIGLSTSLTGTSDPITTRGPGPIPLRDGKEDTRPYFDRCLDTIASGGLSLNQRVEQGLEKLVNYDQRHTTDFDTAAAQLDLIKLHYHPEDPKNPADLKLRRQWEADYGDFIIAAYRAANLPAEFPKIDVGDALPAPSETDVLSDLRDIFQGVGPSAQETVAELSALLQGAGVTPPKPARDELARRMEIERYLREARLHGPFFNEIDRLAKKDAVFGPNPPTADQANQAVIDEVETLAIHPNLVTKDHPEGQDFIVALKAARKDVDAKLDPNAMASADYGKQVFADLGVTKDLATCTKAAALVASASFDVTAGIGYVESGKPGEVKDLKPGGETAWLAFRAPLHTNLATLSPADIGADKTMAEYLLVGGSLTYQRDALLVTGDSANPLVFGDVYGAWLGLDAYFPNYRLGAEAGYTDTAARRVGVTDYSSKGFRWQASGSYQVIPGTWVGVTYGTAQGTTTKLNDRTLAVTLSFSSPPPESVFGQPAKAAAAK